MSPKTSCVMVRRAPVPFASSVSALALLPVAALVAVAPLVTDPALFPGGPGGLAAQEPTLGSVEFPTSGAPQARADFLRGVLYLHSFEYDSAAEAFRRAQDVDPDFAMAYWGEAMTHTHPLWNQQDQKAGREALARLAPTPEARRAKAPTERERAYLAAVEILYGEGSKAARDTGYSQAMAELAARFPEDPEAKAFQALSLLGLGQGVRHVPTYMRAAALAEEVFRDNPRHPGAAHYLIHAYDDPVHAPLGLRAARAYSGIAPDAPHAQHMTTHIFIALGMWDETVSQNELAAGEDRFPNHYTAWLAYGLVQQGRLREARDLLGRVAAGVDTENGYGMAGQRGYLAAMRAHYLVDTGRWGDDVGRWADGPADPSAGASPWSRRVEALSAGLGALERGEREAAEAALAELERLARAAEEAGDGAVARIMALELEAKLALAAGDAERALDLLREATDLEDAMPFEFGPPVVVKPTHELLGEVLLAEGRPAEAAVEFERALELAPRRPASLLGLARAAEASGDTASAEGAYATLLEVWHRADPELDAAGEARSFVRAAGSR